MNHFELNLYANDHNIIDKPNTKDENGQSLLFHLLPRNIECL